MTPRQRPLRVLTGGLFLLLLLAIVAVLRGRDRSLPPETLKERVRKSQQQPAPPPMRPEPAAADAGLATLSGRTIDDLSSRAVPDVVIQIHAQGKLLTDLVSDASGNYQVRLPAGNYDLLAYLVHEDERDVQFLVAAKLDLSPPDVRQDLHFDLHPFVVVEGDVVDASSQPVPKVRVSVHYAGAWNPAWNDPAVYDRVRRFHSLTAGSGDDGGFRIAGPLMPAKYWVHAAHPSYVPFDGEDENTGLTVVPGKDQRHRVVIRLRPENLTTLKGRVISRDGRPVPKASVAVRNGSLNYQALTDGDGRFTYPVRPDPVRVTARHPDYKGAGRDLGVIAPKASPETAPDDVTLVLDAKPFQVRLIVIDEAGRPVDVPLTIAEADPSLGELNPFFEVPVTGGKGGFHADRGLKYHVAAPTNGPWAVSTVTVAGKSAPAPGFLTFDQESTEMTVTLKRR